MAFTNVQVFQHVMTLLNQWGVEASVSEAPHMTLSELDLDSLDMAELLVELESLYDITIDRDDMVIRPEATLQEVIDAVVAVLNVKSLTN